MDKILHRLLSPNGVRKLGGGDDLIGFIGGVAQRGEGSERLVAAVAAILCCCLRAYSQNPGRNRLDRPRSVVPSKCLQIAQTHPTRKSSSSRASAFPFTLFVF